MAGINSAHVSAEGKGRTHARGERRASIVQAAADVLRESGPAAVTYRSVGSRAQCAISLIGYYFTSLDELLSEAGSSVMRSWADRTERVAIEAEQGDPPQSLEEAVDLILTACLPDAESLEVLYFQLVNAARSIPVTRSYQEGRDRLDDAMARVLAWAGVSVPADL